MSEHHKVIIIGAGLSGLYSAYKLLQKETDVILLEARNRIGGRAFTQHYKNSRFDLGPAWVWPQLQPRLNSLLTELNINTYKQYTHGAMLYEKSANEIEQFEAQSSHSESYRIEGSIHNLVNRLEAAINNDNIRLNTTVQKVSQDNMCIETTCEGETYNYSADTIIFALPPRLIQKNITVCPGFSDDIIEAWKNTPTWMAGHCKIVFIYKKPFWRENNLSGEVFSHYGPLSEIYDGSPKDEKFFALTSFVGLNARQRQQINQQQLIKACKQQLLRLFGEHSQDILDIVIKDWSNDEFTSSDLDITSPMHHPQYEQHMPRHFWNKKLILAGTEVAREHGGYLEGALESADEALEILAL